MNFKITSDYKPTGDQPKAINELVKGVNEGETAQVLLGVTGSGKTFTMANTIAKVNKPTLILSHNKTLAAQLYEEMKGFFPENAVEYYVSYYDYYQPEAYLPTTDTYIEKDLAINEEIDRLRLAAVSALLSGRKDVIIVSSVSCIYGMGAPITMKENIISINKGEKMNRNDLLKRLVDSLYLRNDMELLRGHFRVKGEIVDIAMAYSENILRVSWWDDEIEDIVELDGTTYKKVATFSSYQIYPANLFVTSKAQTQSALRHIQDDLMLQIDHFNQLGESLKAYRIKERVEYDMEMIKELGHCAGIENYSRYFDNRLPGERPYCLIDFFPDDFLLFIDESHVSIPQIRAMYGGDRARKENLVEFGFRLPAAFDNRPLKFEEFENIIPQTIYVSATPAEYELEKSEGVIVEQIIRPTGLLDPQIVVRPSENQIDDLIDGIHDRIYKNERVLVTTLTKRMAEELTNYLLENNIKTAYIHSDISTLDRITIIDGVRSGEFDVLVGINLLREGLDLPEVSLIAILDADKEGFLRSYRSLTQTAGRAARNVNGMVIMYADKITDSMQKTIDETNRRRAIQAEYNHKHNIIPTPIKKKNKNIFGSQETKETIKTYQMPNDDHSNVIKMAAEPIGSYGESSTIKVEKQIEILTQKMKEAAKNLEFLQAAQYRDEIIRLKQQISE